MTARFWLPIVFGLGKVALVLIIVLAVLVAVADAGEKKPVTGAELQPCDEIMFARVPPLPVCRTVPRSEQNPQWVIILMSTYIPYMATDAPVSKAYGPERLRKFGPYGHKIDCMKETVRWNNPMVKGYYVECWALDKWLDYHAGWRERTLGFYGNLISDLKEKLPKQDDPLLRQALLREIQFHEDNLKWELEEQ